MNLLQHIQQAEQPQGSGNAQPAQIQVTVVVNLQQSYLNLQINIDPDIPFSVFIEGIKQQIFAQRMQAQYEETIEYQLQNGGNITQQEARTLTALGFSNGCTLYVRLKLKGGPYQPQCKQHNKPITNICISKHNCPYRNLCVDCIFIKHKNIQQEMLPPLETFKQKVQEKVSQFDIVDYSDQLKMLKTLEIQANLFIQQFSYTTKKLIKLIENIDNQALRVKTNLQKLQFVNLTQDELNEMIKFLEIKKYHDKQDYGQNLDNAFEYVDSMTESLKNLNIFTETMKIKIPQQTEENQIQVKIAAHVGQIKMDFLTSIDPDIPFNVFIEQIKSRIFGQKMQAQAEDKLTYFLQEGSTIYEFEARTLAELEFINQCTLLITK